MTRKIKRSPDFELVLEISNDEFIAPPRAAQRNWILNRAMTEWSAELRHLHTSSRGLVAGREQQADIDSGRDWTQAALSDQQIMEDWQIPVMEAMAQVAVVNNGAVLEIGFGRGVAASYIQAQGVARHTIVECNDDIVQRFHDWRQDYADQDIELLHDRWQNLFPRPERYDAVFFHAYPLTQEEFIDEVIQSTTFAGSFFPVAAEQLVEGGVFTYLTNESDSISRAHQRLLLSHFSSFATTVVAPLNIPEDTSDSLWGDSMVIIKAVK